MKGKRNRTAQHSRREGAFERLNNNLKTREQSLSGTKDKDQIKKLNSDISRINKEINLLKSVGIS